MRLRLQKFSYRFAEQVLKSKLSLKQEIDEVLLNSSIKIEDLSRPNFNKILNELFVNKGRQSQPQVFGEEDELVTKIDT